MKHYETKYFKPRILSVTSKINTTYLFKKNGTLYFFNKIETVNHIDLIFSGIHIYPCPHVSCKFGYDIPRNKVTATILVKDTKSGRI